MNSHVHQRAAANDVLVVFPRRAELRQAFMTRERADVVDFPDEAIVKSSLEKANGRKITMIKTGRQRFAALMRRFEYAMASIE